MGRAVGAWGFCFLLALLQAPSAGAAPNQTTLSAVVGHECCREDFRVSLRRPAAARRRLCAWSNWRALAERRRRAGTTDESTRQRVLRGRRSIAGQTMQPGVGGPWEAT